MAASGSIFGTATMATASALKVAIQLVSLPIIGRFLGPEAYGQVALVSPFIILSMLIAESGLGGCIVRSKETSRELEGTIFCFSTALSLVFIAVFSVLAFPLAALLHQPMFAYLLIAMSSILLLASFNIVPASLLLRQQQYQWIALSDVASAIGSLLAVTFGILMGWGVWSLVAQQIGFWVCKVAVVTIASRHLPLFVFSMKILKENIIFGMHLTGTSLVSFFSKNIDNVLIGAFLGASALGYYALAFQVMGLPQMVIGGSVFYTMFSSISQSHRNGSPTSQYFLKMLRGVTVLILPLIIGIGATAPLWVPLVLGDKWLAAVPLIVMLVPYGLSQAFQAASSAVLIGTGRTELTLKLTLINTAITVAAILIGVAIGPIAVATGVSIAAVIGFVLEMRAVLRVCDVDARSAVKVMAGPVIAALAMGACVYSLGGALAEAIPLIVRLPICILAGVLVYSAILFVFFRDDLQSDIDSLKQAVLSRRAVG